MKMSVVLTGSTIALTLTFYLLAYYLLPETPPTAPLMLLFAGIAFVITWGIQLLYRRSQTSSRRVPPKTPVRVHTQRCSPWPPSRCSPRRPAAAQPVLMADYVAQFKQTVGQERFWKPDTLQTFILSRNLLETAAVGLGLSQAAVHSWIEFTK